jgi:hypothetical protein
MGMASWLKTGFWPATIHLRKKSKSTRAQVFCDLLRKVFPLPPVFEIIENLLRPVDGWQVQETCPARIGLEVQFER